MAYRLDLFKKLTVLFAEDNAIALNQIKGILHIFFKDVFVAKDGKEAFELYELHNPDILITDIKMPQIDGIQLTKNIRETKSTIPIILLSSYPDQKTLLRAANSGIDGYILKPIELENLLSTIDKTLQRKPQNQKYFQLSQNLIYNIFTDELYKEGQLLELGKKEKQLLKLFIDNFDKTLSKDNIISRIWELDEVTDSALKNLLNRLRTKLDEEMILCVKGTGWRLNTTK